MEDKEYYAILSEEISRHQIDAEYSKATHYAASTRFDKLYQWYLFPGFLITILGISTLLNCLKDGVCFPCLFSNNISCDVLSHSISLIGVCITVWPLIKDYSGKSVMHRRFAEQYNNISKKCTNWKTEYPRGTNLELAKKSVLSIRESICVINSLSPTTRGSDYKRGQKEINNGSYNYDEDPQ